MEGARMGPLRRDDVDHQACSGYARALVPT
jgi:hypothetical protein